MPLKANRNASNKPIDNECFIKEENAKQVPILENGFTFEKESPVDLS